MTSLFNLGRLFMTAGTAALGIGFMPYLARHAAGDWGDLDDFDRRQNDLAARLNLRIFSAYDTDEGVRIWIITEGDRLATTVLLPEY